MSPGEGRLPLTGESVWLFCRPSDRLSDIRETVGTLGFLKCFTHVGGGLSAFFAVFL